MWQMRSGMHATPQNGCCKQRKMLSTLVAVLAATRLRRALQRIVCNESRRSDTKASQRCNNNNNSETNNLRLYVQ